MPDGIKLSLPSERDVWGSHALHVFRKYGTTSTVTDLVKLSRGAVKNQGNGLCLTRTWEWGLTGWIYVISYDGTKDSFYAARKDGVIRPICYFSDDQFDFFMKNIAQYADENTNCDEVYFGEYPQNAVDSDLQKEIAEALSYSRLPLTGRIFTLGGFFDNPRSSTKQYLELKYKGKKYIFFKAVCDYSDEVGPLSNGEKWEYSQEVVLEVLPVAWLVDYENKLLLSQKGLVSGINHINDIFSFVDEKMARELFQSASVPTLVQTPDPVIEDSQEEATVEEVLDQAKMKMKKIIGGLNLK